MTSDVRVSLYQSMLAGTENDINFDEDQGVDERETVAHSDQGPFMLISSSIHENGFPEHLSLQGLSRNGTPPGAFAPAIWVILNAVGRGTLDRGTAQ